jgi:hypothetical protein
MRRSAPFLSVSLLVIAFFISSASAAVVCYEDAYYPSVAKLERTKGGIAAQLGGRFSKPVELFVYTPQNRWKKMESLCGFGLCSKNEEKEIQLPPVALSYAEAVALVPELDGIGEDVSQEIVSRTLHKNVAWFGIGFYSGEGVSGVGGVGKFDLETRRVEIRRPGLIRDSSIGPILYDGRSLWFGTFGRYECLGDPPTHGLIRYDWETDRIESFEKKSDGPCGFRVNDLLRERDTLWAATSLGLSIRDDKSGRWRHYVPEPGASPHMRETTCPDLYRALLETIPNRPNEDPNPFTQFFDELARFQPAFLKNHIKIKTPEAWDCSEIRFLASQAADVEVLLKEIVSFHPTGTRYQGCWIDGFGRRKSNHPKWRDLLLSALAPKGKNQQPAGGEAVKFLEPFQGDDKVAQLLVHRLRTDSYPFREAKMLPSFLGNKSIPVLIEVMDKFKNDWLMLSSIEKVLEKATGHYFNPKRGTIEVLPELKQDITSGIEGSETIFIARWTAWWEANKNRYLPPEKKP